MTIHYTMESMFLVAIIAMCILIYTIAATQRIRPPIVVSIVIAAITRIGIVILFPKSWSFDEQSFLLAGRDLLMKNPIYFEFYFPFVYYLGAFALIIKDFVEPMAFLKLFFAVFDLGVTYYIYRISGDRLASFLYAVNPSMLMIITVHGQIDSLPLFFLLAATFSAIHKKEMKSALLFGFGLLIKHWPVLFIASFIVHAKKPIVYIFSIIIPIASVFIHSFISGIHPYYIFRQIYGYRGLYTVWGANILLMETVPKLLEQSIRYIRFGFIFLFGLFSFFKKESSLVSELFRLMVVFFCFTPMFASQWLSWIIPFMLIKRPKGWWLFITLSAIYHTANFTSEAYPNVFPINISHYLNLVLPKISLLIWGTMWYILISLLRSTNMRGNNHLQYMQQK